MHRWLETDEGDANTVAHSRDLAVPRDIIKPAIGGEFAAFVTTLELERALRRVYQDQGTDTARDPLTLLRHAYRARHQGWTDHDPTEDFTLRSLR